MMGAKSFLFHRKRNLFNDKSPRRPLSSSPIKRDSKDDVKMVRNSHEINLSSFFNKTLEP